MTKQVSESAELVKTVFQIVNYWLKNTP